METQAKESKVRTRLLKRDYNEELEEIAESKSFEKESQNLLLSMLYKVEGAYDDYEIVKRKVPSKEKFLENILNIVKKDCNEIQIAKPNSLLEKELESSKCKILEKNGKQKIIIFPNEKVVLYSIIKASMDKNDTKLTLDERAILSAIQIGKCIAYSEAIRDFNGYAWSTVKREIESIECNVIYTNLIYLLGDEKVSSFNSSNIHKLKKYISEELYNEIKGNAIKFYLFYNKDEMEKIHERINSNKQMLKEMEMQKQFVESISNSKKSTVFRIGKIDELLNNPQILRKEYVAKNKNLPDNKKIFSVSHYEEDLQNERKGLVKQLEKYSKLQNPIQYVKIKTNLEEEIKCYTDLDKVNITNMQKIFLRDFRNKLKTIDNRLDIIDYIYQIRYLKFLPINKKERMKDRIDFSEIERDVIEKAIKNDVITPISNNIDTDYNLIKSIFDSRTINLEELYIRLSVESGKLKAEIFDGEMIDSTNYIELKRNSNVQIRKTKKVKIFN